jgi:hypothetical protein
LTADEGAFWPWQPMGGCRAWQAARPTADMTVHEPASSYAWGTRVRIGSVPGMNGSALGICQVVR